MYFKALEDCRTCKCSFKPSLGETYCYCCLPSTIRRDAKPIKIGYELEYYPIALASPHIPARTVIFLATIIYKGFKFGLRLSIEDTVKGQCLEFITHPVLKMDAIKLYDSLLTLANNMHDELKHVGTTLEMEYSRNTKKLLTLSNLLTRVNRKNADLSIHNPILRTDVSLYYDATIKVNQDMHQHLQINFSYAEVTNQSIKWDDKIITLVACNQKLVHFLQSTFFQGEISLQGQIKDFSQQGKTLLSNFKLRYMQLIHFLFSPELVTAYCLNKRFIAKLYWLIFLFELESLYFRAKMGLKVDHTTHKDASGGYYDLYQNTQKNKNNYGPKDLVPLCCRGFKDIFTVKELDFIMNIMPAVCRNTICFEDFKTYIQTLAMFVDEECKTDSFSAWPKMQAELVLEARLPVRGSDMIICRQLVQTLCG